MFRLPMLPHFVAGLALKKSLEYINLRRFLFRWMDLWDNVDLLGDRPVLLEHEIELLLIQNVGLYER